MATAFPEIADECCIDSEVSSTSPKLTTTKLKETPLPNGCIKHPIEDVGLCKPVTETDAIDDQDNTAEGVTSVSSDDSGMGKSESSSEQNIVDSLASVSLTDQPELSDVLDGIRYVVYESELQMPDIMRLITKDLSEPYSIYTYRYFIHNWPKLCFLVSTIYFIDLMCRLFVLDPYLHLSYRVNSQGRTYQSLP